MNKLFFLSIMILISLSGWGGGGVDVGSANQKSAQGTFGVGTHDTEEELVNYVQGKLQEIENGNMKEVQKLISKGRCSSKDIKFSEVEILTAYQYVEKSAHLQKEFSGVVTVDLKDCKRPHRLNN